MAPLGRWGARVHVSHVSHLGRIWNHRWNTMKSPKNKASARCIILFGIDKNLEFFKYVEQEKEDRRIFPQLQNGYFEEVSTLSEESFLELMGCASPWHWCHLLKASVGCSWEISCAHLYQNTGPSQIPSTLTESRPASCRLPLASVVMAKHMEWCSLGGQRFEGYHGISIWRYDSWEISSNRI